MIDLYGKYRIILFSILLLLCIIMCIHSYNNYIKKIYKQYFYVIGYILLSIAVIIILIKAIYGPQYFPFPTFSTPIGILGLIFVIIGRIQERRRKKLTKNNCNRSGRLYN